MWIFCTMRKMSCSLPSTQTSGLGREKLVLQLFWSKLSARAYRNKICWVSSLLECSVMSYSPPLRHGMRLKFVTWFVHCPHLGKSCASKGTHQKWRGTPETLRVIAGRSNRGVCNMISNIAKFLLWEIVQLVVHYLLLYVCMRECVFMCLDVQFCFYLVLCSSHKLKSMENQCLCYISLSRWSQSQEGMWYRFSVLKIVENVRCISRFNGNVFHTVFILSLIFLKM